MENYKNIKYKDLENMPIDNFNLSARTRNSLKRVGIENFAQVITLSERELARIRNLGQESIKELDIVIRSMNNEEIHRNMPMLDAYTIGMDDKEEKEFIRNNIDKILDMHPRDIGISKEVYEKLEKCAVNSVFKLVICNEIKLNRLFEEKEVNEIKILLSKLNLHLAMTKDEIDNLNPLYVMFKLRDDSKDKEFMLKSLLDEKERLTERLDYINNEIEKLTNEDTIGGKNNGHR